MYSIDLRPADQSSGSINDIGHGQHPDLERVPGLLSAVRPSTGDITRAMLYNAIHQAKCALQADFDMIFKRHFKAKAKKEG